MTDAQLREILEKSRVIAVVGLSDNPDRDSHRVAAYLRAPPAPPDAAYFALMTPVPRSRIRRMKLV